jgi:hypothetical protein
MLWIGFRNGRKRSRIRNCSWARGTSNGFETNASNYLKYWVIIHSLGIEVIDTVAANTQETGLAKCMKTYIYKIQSYPYQ